MAHQKIQAGKTIDALTKDELNDALGSHLRSWVAEVAQGGRYPRFQIQGTVTSAGLLNLGGHVGQYALGPQAGFVWDVRRLHISGLSVGDTLGIYTNEPAPSQLIATTSDLGDTAVRSFYWSHQVVLYPGETLKVYGTGLASTGTITVSGQVLELPVGLAWKLT